MGGFIQFEVQDMNGNPTAAGSTISVTADSAVGTISSQTGSYNIGAVPTLGAPGRSVTGFFP